MRIVLHKTLLKLPQDFLVKQINVLDVREYLPNLLLRKHVCSFARLFQIALSEGEEEKPCLILGRDNLNNYV